MVLKNTINKIEPWQKIHIPKTNLNNIAFYPLSGADFINLYLMFPEAIDYLMVALEKSGDAPQIDRLDDTRMSAGLNFIQNGLIQYGNNNYFATNTMTAYLHNNYITGIAPIIMIFMTRMGHKVIDVKPVGIGNDGKLSFLDNKGMINNKKIENTGVLIHFKDKTSGTIKRFVYLVSLLNARNVSGNTASGRYFNEIGRTRTIMKSAIYLCHLPKYKKLADFFIAKSDVIVQDDSGIPYRFLIKDRDIKLYGNYIRIRIDNREGVYQPDLEKEYKKSSDPLPFFFGYGILFGKDKSNMLIAVRKK
jgi:hypothetical protein